MANGEVVIEADSTSLWGLMVCYRDVLGAAGQQDKWYYDICESGLTSSSYMLIKI